MLINNNDDKVVYFMKKLIAVSVIALLVTVGANYDKGSDLADASYPDIQSISPYSFEV